MDVVQLQLDLLCNPYVMQLSVIKRMTDTCAK